MELLQDPIDFTAGLIESFLLLSIKSLALENPIRILKVDQRLWHHFCLLKGSLIGQFNYNGRFFFEERCKLIFH